jgi:CheY-like chemotaxis protein
MPRMDGYAATRAIRAEEPEGQRIPVLAMTAAAVEGERERCLAAGMDDFLTKPVDSAALAAVLERWVGGVDQPATHVATNGATNSAATTATGASTLPDVPATGDHPSLDGLALERLDELRDLDPGDTTYLDRAIGNFVRNTPETLASIRQAIADGDAPTLKQVSHKLAGGALNLGVTPAGRTAQQIELLADTGSVDGTAALADQLEQDLEVGRASLLAYQATYSTGPAGG